MIHGRREDVARSFVLPYVDRGVPANLSYICQNLSFSKNADVELRNDRPRVRTFGGACRTPAARRHGCESSGQGRWGCATAERGGAVTGAAAAGGAAAVGVEAGVGAGCGRATLDPEAKMGFQRWPSHARKTHWPTPSAGRTCSVERRTGQLGLAPLHGVIPSDTIRVSCARAGPTASGTRIVAARSSSA